MHKNGVNKIEKKFHIKIRSKIHPDIFHTIEINLQCNETMPGEEELCKSKKLIKNIYVKKYGEGKRL